MKSTISYTKMSWFVAHSSLIEVETEQIKRIPHSMRFILDVVSGQKVYYLMVAQEFNWNHLMEVIKRKL